MKLYQAMYFKVKKTTSKRHGCQLWYINKLMEKDGLLVYDDKLKTDSVSKEY